MEPYDRLIAVLDAFIDVFDGGIAGVFRIRGIQTAMLLEKTTAEGSGISMSELARHTDAPFENVRRHITTQLEIGTLRALTDPDDERVARILVTEQGSQLYDTLELVRRLGELSEDAGKGDFDGTPPHDEILAVLQSFLNCYPGGMRVREIKRELLIQRATLLGTGITISELARQTNTPLETVRRHIAKSVAQGPLRCLEDPNDDRKMRVLFSEPDKESQRAADVAAHLANVNWAKFLAAERDG